MLYCAYPTSNLSAEFSKLKCWTSVLPHSSLLPLDLNIIPVCFLLQLTFSGAIIEVCMRKLVFYPEIVGFLEEDKDDFPYVEARYVYGSPPKLIMLDDKGDQKETIR